MAKNSWNDYSATAANNTDVGNVNTSETMNPSDVNDAVRELMSHTADVVAGTVALSSINIDGGSITGITDLAVADGGTGASTLTANGVLFGNGTSAIGVTAVGTSGQVLTSNGSSAPTFQNAAGGGGGTWSVIANGSSISAGTYTDISGYKYVKAIFGTAGGYNVGPSLSTSNSSNSGVSVSNGHSYQTVLSGSSTFSNYEVSYSPSTSSLYYGNSYVPVGPHAFRVELFGLDQTNVGIRTGLEGAAGVWDNTTFIGQTSSGSSSWYFYNANAVAYHLIIGVT